MLLFVQGEVFCFEVNHHEKTPFGRICLELFPTTSAKSKKGTTIFQMVVDLRGGMFSM